MNSTLSSQVIEAPGKSEFQYRYRAYSPIANARALVVYLPQYGGTLDEWENTLLPERLASNGIASLVGLPVPEGTGYMTDLSLQALHAMLADAMQHISCQPDKLVLGGFSAGGVGAVRYGEVAVQGSLPGAFRPRAIFAVDPPLDLRRWYRGLQLIVQRNQPSPSLDEAREVIQVLHYILGGAPDEVPEAYAHASAVMAFAEDGGNLKYLRDVPIRIYTEPDVLFFLEHCTDLYSLNTLDVVFAINELRAMGNQQAELIVTSGKGYRPDLGGIRMPHDWSIVDEPDLANWIEQKLG
ncbi:MAG TPA: hypothetical protein VFR47_28115 [Anaerolineales bacterium]|nr:hypothetical protein [Anaerolineales bacterium]